MAAVAQQDVPIYREWLGTTLGFVVAQIRPRVNGYLLTQDYREGTLVKAGDLLFTIDPRPYQNSLDQATGKLAQAQAQRSQAQAQLTQSLAEIAQARAQVAQAESDVARAVATQRKTELEVERYTPLAARGSLSQQELDNTVQNNLANIASVEAARASLASAVANVERAQAAADKARADIGAAEANIAQAQAARAEALLNLGWARVTSPLDGLAGIKKADVGDLVGPATVLATVALIDPIYVQFSVTEQEYLRYRRTHAALGPRSDFELTLADGEVYPHRGTAVIFGLEVDPTTGTIPIRATFPNPGSVLRPGQFAKMRLAVDVMKGALLVPQRAVRDLQGLYQVGVVGPGDVVTVRNVRVGERSGERWVVAEGLAPGDRVIVEGLEKVKTGDKVAPGPVK